MVIPSRWNSCEALDKWAMSITDCFTSIITCFARVELYQLDPLSFDNKRLQWSSHQLHKLNDSPRDVSDHPQAMAMDRILRNDVCELFSVQWFWYESS